MPTLCWGIGKVTDEPTVKLYSGKELVFIERGMNRIEADIREIRCDINDLKSTVALKGDMYALRGDMYALKGDMYKILGLMALAAAGTAGVAALILEIPT